MTRFSVVIPAYNAARTVEQTIRSVLAQSETNLELIVVDDGSADETPALVTTIAADDSRVTLVEQANAGTAGARNTGISHASAGYVSFLDNDDLWTPNYLERMGRALGSEPDAGFAYCDAWSLDDATLRIRRRTELEARPPPPPGARWEQVLLELAAANFVMSSATVRREALTETGGFATDVLGVDDYDLWFRILLSGRTAVRAASAPLLLQRDRHDSQSKDDPMMLLGLRRVLERALADERTPEPVRELLATQLRSVEREAAMTAGERPLLRGLHALRRSAIKVRDLIAGDRLFYEQPPPEVAAAFPELVRN